jgi:ATP-dependent Lhr-like helicase
MARVSGASVVLVNGQLAAFLRRQNPSIKVFLPDSEPERSHVAACLAWQVAELAVKRHANRRSGLLISQINDGPARQHFLSSFLEEAGFSDSASGYYMRRVASVKPITEVKEEEFAEDPSASETA